MRDVRWKLLRLLLPLLHGDHLNQSSDAGRYWDDYEATDTVVVFHRLDTNTQTHSQGLDISHYTFSLPTPRCGAHTRTHTYRNTYTAWEEEEHLKLVIRFWVAQHLLPLSANFTATHPQKQKQREYTIAHQQTNFGVIFPTLNATSPGSNRFSDTFLCNFSKPLLWYTHTISLAWG